jgi:hypothetical protein
MLISTMINKSKLHVEQAFLVLLSSLTALSFLNTSAQSQTRYYPSPTPTPYRTQPRPAPVPTRNPNTPIYSRQLGGGTSLQVNPSKTPPAAVVIPGGRNTETRIGPYSPPKGGYGVQINKTLN